MAGVVVMSDTGAYFLKVSPPQFQLPQIVLDNLPAASAEDIAAAVTEYLESNPPGLTLDDVSFMFTQATPEAVWEIIHPLPFDPNVTVTDSAGTAVQTEIIYPAPHLVRSIAAGAFSGTARLS